MQISKWHLLVCAAVICGSTAAIRADDNPDQAAARAALEAKMRNMNAQPANAQTSAPAAQKPTNPPPAEKPGMTTAPARTTRPASTTPGSDHGLFAPVPPASGKIPAAAPAQKTRSASPAPSPDQGLFAPVPPPSGNATGWSTANLSSTNAQTLSPFQGPFFTGASQNTNALHPGRKLGLKTITAPPLPISAAQQTQLQALLNKYDANIISPDQYQAERAKILAEHK